MKIVAIVQARMGSSRLPGKVLSQIGDEKAICLLLGRLSRSYMINQIVLATTTLAEDDVLVDAASNSKVGIFRGDERDVLDRYVNAARIFEADIVVRITGDCPFVDSVLVDKLLEAFVKQEDLDYLCNNYPPTYPDGLDIECIRISALERCARDAHLKDHREHVTMMLRNSDAFNWATYKNEKDYSHLRLTLDEPEDLNLLNSIAVRFKNIFEFSFDDLIELYNNEPEVFNSNLHIRRNEGSDMSSGQKMWRRAKRIIPGGNMLLSKRPEMFLPDNWPAYFSKTSGCKVWDLDDNEFLDLTLMGIGTNLLGYSHVEVDEAVANTLSMGNMSTLNCPEEVLLAERLVDLNPWSDMARFARSGGEANAIAIRLARAATGKSDIAVCGYHGWHDYYLAANLDKNSSLDGHLLPGLNPLGVPDALRGTTFTFKYNNINELKKIVEDQNLAAIQMEVMRNIEPAPGFLEEVRALASANGIVLIFDECSSGFRETFGGLHMKYGVEPDMAMFGKALGNGYAITALLGRKEVMEYAQETFISSTFWTERIGPSAALKTLEVMEREKSWEIVSNNGRKVKKFWESQSSEEIPLLVSGLDAMPSFSITNDDWLLIKTFITQEMLYKGILASNSIYLSLAHSDEALKKYEEEITSVFDEIKKIKKSGRLIKDQLKGPQCHSGFQRLN